MILPIFKNIKTTNKMIYGQIKDILKDYNFSGPSKFGVWKWGYSTECFISCTEQSLNNIRGLRNWSIKKANFLMVYFRQWRLTGPPLPPSCATINRAILPVFQDSIPQTRANWGLELRYLHLKFTFPFNILSLEKIPSNCRHISWSSAERVYRLKNSNGCSKYCNIFSYNFHVLSKHSRVVEW